MSLGTPASWAVSEARDYAVLVSATAQTSPPQITVNWAQDTFAVPTSYEVSRKLATERAWTLLATLSGNETSFVDTNVSANTKYEYQLKKVAVGYTGYGYVMTGSEIPLREERGKLLLVVDNTYAAELTNELSRLQQDLVGDGWRVIRHDVSRDDTASNVKALIKADYDADPANVRSVFLFGHVPVAYSGDIVPDGHNPDHRGAWPADVYYADVDYTWGDATITSTNSSYPRQHNRPGDGKFDFSTATMLADLEIGRVDLANLPQFARPEVELLRQYLNKDHNFRHKVISARSLGLVADFFGTFSGSAFAATGWRNFAAFFGASNVTATTDWFGALTNNSYLCAYGCGGGTFTSVDGVTTTAQLATRDPQTVFTFLFGSYFGDWDSTNNVMRAALATPSYTLTSAWAGRPHWFVHHMGLGETIGYSTRLTQINNNAACYKQINPGSQQIHIALMGDPTLRLHPVAPPAALTTEASGAKVMLNWTDSPEPVLGYNVYRGANPLGPFTRLNEALIATNTYTDVNLASGDYTFMVRAVRLEVSASGSYFNASQGAFATASVSAAPPLEFQSLADQTVELGTNWKFVAPVASGGCGEISVTELYTQTNTTCGNAFAALRVWQATDPCGTTNYITNTVAVVDTTAPTLTKPADQTIELGGVWDFESPQASDPGGEVTLTVVGTVTNLGAAGTFTATRVWQASDPCGNSAQTSQTISVGDSTAPTISQPGNKTVELGNEWMFDAPTATDPGGVLVQVVSTTTNAGSGNTFTATCTWQVADGCSNALQSAQTVTVVDTTAPTLTQQPAKSVELGNAWSFDAPTASDLGGDVTIQVLSTVTNAGVSNSFVAICTWQATDPSGNSAQSSQAVTVRDTTAPAIAPLVNRTVELGQPWSFDTPEATDLGGPVAISVVNVVTNAGRSELANPTTIVCNWLATDAAGNAAEAAQVITIVDTTAPTLSAPADKSVLEGTAWTFDPPTTTDASGEVALTVLNVVTNGDGPTFTATCTWLATDASGNTNQCNQTVTVLSAGPVVLSLSASATSLYEGEGATITLSRTGSTTAAVTARLEFSGAAKQGADFDPLPHEITLPAGAKSVMLNLSTRADNQIEKTESLTVTLEPGESYGIGEAASVSFEIYDTTVKRK